MIRGTLVILFSLLALQVQAKNLLALNFQQKDDLSYLDLLFDNEDVEVVKNHVVNDKQIVLDLKGVESSDRVMRAFDTSEFSGAIVFVSAYKRPSSPDDIRVVLQLRENVRSQLKTIGKRTVLTIENRFGALSKNKIAEGDTLKPRTVVKKSSVKINVPKSDSVEDILENLTLSGKKKYIGKKITLNVKDLPVSNVLEMIAEASGFNIIQPSSGGKAPMTMNLVNIPWDQALDTMLRLNDLVAQKNGSILIIKTLQEATNEAKARSDAEAKRLESEPLLTKIFPVSYADAKSMETIVSAYITKRGAIQIDERTNSMIVKETQDAIDKIEKILGFLDTQTPQVLIESKFVEIFENHAKSVGLVQGLSFGYDPVTDLSTVANSAGELANGNTGGFSFSTAPIDGDSARDALGVSIERYGRLTNLNFTLQLLESESKAKIVASPRVVTKHKVPATLSSTDHRSFSVSTTNASGSTNTFEKDSAVLLINVTPQVTNDGAIDLTLGLKKEQFTTRPAPGAPFDKTSRDLTTNVLVDNGSTIVLGGLYNYATRQDHSGVPFLKDLPLVGWLFRTPYNPTIEKSELVIFITPRIINQEEAGLTTNI